MISKHRENIFTTNFKHSLHMKQFSVNILNIERFVLKLQ